MLTAGLLAGTAFSQTILLETFEAGLPATWSQTTLSTDGGWNNGTAATLSSAYWTIGASNTTKIMATNDDDCNCNKSADRLISPSFNLTGQTLVNLSVDLFFNKGSYQGNTEVGTIEVSTDGGTTWTVLSDLTQIATWHTDIINLNAYAGMSDVKISFKYNDATGWLFGMAIDNFKVYVPQPDDAVLVSSTLNRYSLISTNNTLGLSVKNNGANAITSVTVDWNDGTSHSSVISTNIAPGATATVNHPTAVNYATANTNNLAISITNVNGNVDPNMGDNVGTGIITTLSQAPTKTVLIEEGTGTWCGWCPRGAVAMDYMYNTYPTQFVGIAVHNGDPMTVTAYDNGADLSGYPGCNVDRVLLDQSVSQAAFVNFYNTRKDLLTPASVGLTATAVGSALTVDVNSTFYSNFPAANYRLGVILVEDGVTGTGSGYNQVNYYAGGSNGAMGGYEALPDPVPAAQMVYDHVGRALLGGYSGQVGSVPASLTDGQNVAYTFNYTIPGTMNVNNMTAVAVVIDNASGEVVNAEKTDITVVAGVEELASINMTIFPNPATDNINVSFDADGGNYVVTLTDLAGKVVSTNNVSNASGTSTVTIDVANLKAGNYLVAVANGSASYTKMVTIK